MLLLGPAALALLGCTDFDGMIMDYPTIWCPGPLWLTIPSLLTRDRQENYNMMILYKMLLTVMVSRGLCIAPQEIKLLPMTLCSFPCEMLYFFSLMFIRYLIKTVFVF